MTEIDRRIKEYFANRPEKEISHAVAVRGDIFEKQLLKKSIEALLKWAGERSFIDALSVKNAIFLSKEFDFGRKTGLAVRVDVERIPVEYKNLFAAFVSLAEQTKHKNEALERQVFSEQMAKYELCKKLSGHDYESCSECFGGEDNDTVRCVTCGHLSTLEELKKNSEQ